MEISVGAGLAAPARRPAHGAEKRGRLSETERPGDARWSPRTVPVPLSASATTKEASAARPSAVVNTRSPAERSRGTEDRALTSRLGRPTRAVGRFVPVSAEARQRLGCRRGLPSCPSIVIARRVRGCLPAGSSSTTRRRSSRLRSNSGTGRGRGFEYASDHRPIRAPGDPRSGTGSPRRATASPR